MAEIKDDLSALRIEREPLDAGGKRWTRWLLLVLLMAGAGGGAWYWLNRERPIEVELAPVTARAAGTQASVLNASGYVTTRRRATVSSKVTGKVQEVLIEEGQRVEANQVMARLDPVDANAQRALAASQLAAARSEIGSVRAQLREAEANATRMENLVKQKLVSTAQYEEAIASRDSLRAQLETALRNEQGVLVYEVPLR